ncbi:MAG: 2-polyprenyl-3-methyl-6-methoxy-1,4-benzoquinone monooxygenase [Limnobacter sp.]|nr:2-polyprenyl-3-methyl-6-methoxy-1,4-benzoquinone monooxygenase [Limnobacter sp.]
MAPPAPPSLSDLKFPSVDSVLNEVDKALRTLAAKPVANRPNPSAHTHEGQLADGEKADVIGMMRVNHVGEICAQALYQGQALASADPAKKALFMHAAEEEADHLAWTQERLDELGGRPSLLNPIWYAGAFALGYVAGQLGDKVSLGFMAETERQVEQHLNSHLQRLPSQDLASRAIVEQMKMDEIEHGKTAQAEGATALPLPVKMAMTGMSKVMTTLAHRI